MVHSMQNMSHVTWQLRHDIDDTTHETWKIAKHTWHIMLETLWMTQSRWHKTNTWHMESPAVLTLLPAWQAVPQSPPPLHWEAGQTSLVHHYLTDISPISQQYLTFISQLSVKIAEVALKWTDTQNICPPLPSHPSPLPILPLPRFFIVYQL